MDFTYQAYRNLLEKLKKQEYTFECYDNTKDDYTVICRHDIDTSLAYAIPIAEMENELAISAVYFVLVSTDFYNVFSKENRLILKKIRNLGHKIGLHFDASLYSWDTIDDLENEISNERKILEYVLGEEVNVISFHRPVKELFNKSLRMQLTSAYESTYFSGYEYLSDSRRNWRKNPCEIIKARPKHIQLLTHPIWYSEEIPNEASDAVFRLKTSLKSIIENALYVNITDYEELMKESNNV